MKQKALGTKLLMAAITLGLLAYFGVQAFLYFTDPFYSTMAYTYQVEKEIRLSGYVVRDERVLEEGSDLLHVLRGEGERVSKGGRIALTYADEASMRRQQEIDNLTLRKEQLQYAQEAAVGAEAALRLDNQIFQSILDYRKCLVSGKFYDAEGQGEELRALVLKRDYTYTNQANLPEQIEELTAKIKELKSQSSESVRRINAPASGLFSAVVDGFESVLTPAAVLEWTPEQLSSVSAEGDAASGVGRLILGKSWYYAAVVPADQAAALETAKENGTTLHLRFTKGVERELPVTVVSVRTDEKGNAAVVFHGDTYLQELTLLRRQSAEVIFGKVEGIRVPKDALRIMTQQKELEDGTTEEVRTTGVYCVVGMEARFKPVNVLYSGEGFVLVKAAAPADREELWLRSGDEIIISAKDLYDGKVIGIT